MNFKYHDYRNTDIDNYLPAIKTLIKKNFYVVRMGNIAGKKANINNNKFIDYPFHPLRSDFMDFFLAHRCYFWIGANAGVDSIAEVFRKPMVIINMAPFGLIRMSRKKKILISKIYTNSKRKKLNISEIFAYNLAFFDHSKDLKKKLIKLKSIKPNECKNAVIEMLNLMRDSWRIKNKKDLALEKKFKRLFLEKIKEFNFSHLHGKLNSIYSVSFLKKNQWLLT